MSKLYEQYLKLKHEEPKKLYLFKSGLFCIALEDDALLLSEKFNLKLTNFGNSTLKCGFPESRLKYYTEHFKIQSIDYILVKMDSKKNNTQNISNSIKNETTMPFPNNQLNNIEINNTHLQSFSNPNINNEIIPQIIYDLAILDINNLTLKNSFDKLYEFHIKAKKIVNQK